MILNCVIIDDSKSSISLLTDYLSESKTNLRLINTYTDPASALTAMKTTDLTDIVFMDILMPNINGIELSKLLKDKIRYLVITTCDGSYAIEAFEVNASYYLLKPISLKKFNEAIDKILELEKKRYVQMKDAQHFFIKSNIGELRKLYVNDIIAIEGASNYVKIHTSSRKSYITYGKMQDYEYNLCNSGSFIRVSKSFIISLSAIKLIKRKKITLTNDLQTCIGDTYRDSVKKHLEIF